MKNALMVIREQVKHFYLIRRLSIYELKSKNRNNYLGTAWEIINPMIQIAIYWFVFGTLRKRAPIQMEGVEISFFYWLLAGFFLWIFFYQSVIEGSKSIYTRLRMLSKMNFPMSLIPNIVIFSKFYIHLVMLAISIVFLNIVGYTISLYYLQLFYYILAAFCLIFSISLITSTLSTIVRDVHMFLNATLRMMLYISGILWPLSQLEELEIFPILTTILKYNPLYYLVGGYRASLLGTEWHFISNWNETLSFWIIVIVLFWFGSLLHVKFRRHFIDYL